jgi:hypothetical protein
MPSDLEAKIGVHTDTQNPDQIEEVFGYLRLIGIFQLYYGSRWDLSLAAV